MPKAKKREAFWGLLSQLRKKLFIIRSWRAMLFWDPVGILMMYSKKAKTWEATKTKMQLAP